MRIDSVSPRPDRSGRYTVRFSDGSVMRLYRQTMEDFSIYSGAELSDEQMKAFKEAAGAMSAKMRAVRILSASSVSKKDLQQRLVQKGEDPAQAEAAVKWMEDLDLLDDEKTARQIVSRCISKGYGVNRARQALYEKKIPKELWETVLQDYPDQMDAIVSFLSGRAGKSMQDPERRKAIDALFRKGHSYQNIRRGLERLSMDTEDFPEEL